MKSRLYGYACPHDAVTPDIFPPRVTLHLHQHRDQKHLKIPQENRKGKKAK